MQRYSAQVKLYAIDERRAGKPWKQVQYGIREKFNVEPPSLRAMEKWQKTLDGEQLRQLAIEEGKKMLPESTVLQQVASGLIPILWQTHDAGEDMERETWLWFFSVIERQLGRDRFEQYFDEYRNKRG